ncbi:MAG: T9SS type A sorting domain-containing protein [Chitinophagales bacterium]
MRKLCYLLLVLVICTNCAAQGYWMATSAPPLLDRYDDIYFLNNDTGWAVKNTANGNAAVLKTQNHGISWQQMAAPVTAVYRDIGFLNAKNGFIGILEANGNDTAVMYQSVDSGNSWQPGHNIPGPRPMGICGQNVINDSTLTAVGRYYGPAVFLKTTNSGSSWSYKDMSAYAGGLVDVLFFNKDTGIAVGTNAFFATGNGVVLYTTDGGNNWQLKKTSSHSQEMCWKISFPTRDTGYVSLESFRNMANDTQYVLKTVDGGLTWQEQQFCVCGIGAQAIGFRNSTEGWVGGRAHASNPPQYIYHTVNGGASWGLDSIAVNPNRFRFLNPNHGFLSGERIYEYRNPSCKVYDTLNVQVCLGKSFQWYDSTYTHSASRTVVLPSAQGCDSFITLNLTVSPLQAPETHIFDTTCARTYTFADTVFNLPYTQNITYSRLFKAVDGCDSVVTVLHLASIKIYSYITATICAGQTYNFNGQIISAGGFYADTFTAANGCDSFRYLNLYVTSPLMHGVYDTICHGGSVNFFGQVYNTAGIYNHHLTNPAGCDSIVVLALYVKPSPVSAEQQTICQGKSFLFNGAYLTQTGSYWDTIIKPDGCDSLHRLNLTVTAAPVVAFYDTICHGSSYLFNGQLRTTTGIYRDTLTGVSGCDSVSELHLYVENYVTTSVNAGMCPGSSYVFMSDTLFTPGTYNYYIPLANGCDSVVVLNLHYITYSIVTTLHYICSGGPGSYNFFGQILTAPGLYRDTLISSAGCDSIVQVQIAYASLASDHVFATACNGSMYTYNGQQLTTSGIYTDTLKAQNGCDSLVQYLHLTFMQKGSNLTGSFCKGGYYLFQGDTLTQPGVYSDTITTVQGCDSVVNLVLSEYQFANNLQVQLCPGDVYFFNDSAFSQAGMHSAVFHTADGCDSVVTLNLTVNFVSPVSAGFLPDEVCIYGPQYSLLGGPPGGAYSGAGMMNNIFDPLIAGEGVHQIIYTYSDNNGCTQSDTLSVIVSLCSGLIDEFADGVDVYPNPTKGEVNVNNSSGTKISGSLYSLSGVLVKDLFLEKPAKHLAVDISTFAAGAYLLKLWDNEGHQMYRRLVLNK